MTPPRFAFASLMMLWVVAGCPEIHAGAVDARGIDAGPPRLRDAGPPPVSPDAGGEYGPVPEPPPGVAVCAGVVCGEGEECCIRTGACFDPDEPGACALTPEEAAAVGPGACASNADCAAEDLCVAIFAEEPAEAAVCFGRPGRCKVRASGCAPSGYPANLGRCGCDGRTYRDECEAARAGVDALYWTGCGGHAFGRGTPWESSALGCRDWTDCPPETTCIPFRLGAPDDPPGMCEMHGGFRACGTDAQCGPGTSCCEMLGACLPEELCFLPPPGTMHPCRTQEDCDRWSGNYWVAGSNWQCIPASCEPGAFGGCRGPTGDCRPLLEPYCACDGRTYANYCELIREGGTPDHPGECE